MPILAVSYSTSSMSWSCRVQEIWSHKITNAYRTMKRDFTSRIHSSNCDGDVTMLEYVFIYLNLCCIQWYKFRVCTGKGSRDTVTQITRSQLHISLLRTLINFNLCCIQRTGFKSHVHSRQGSGDTIGQSYPYAPKPQNMVNFTGL